MEADCPTCIKGLPVLPDQNNGSRNPYKNPLQEEFCLVLPIPECKLPLLPVHSPDFHCRLRFPAAPAAFLLFPVLLISIRFAPMLHPAEHGCSSQWFLSSSGFQSGHCSRIPLHQRHPFGFASPTAAAPAVPDHLPARGLPILPFRLLSERIPLPDQIPDGD